MKVTFSAKTMDNFTVPLKSPIPAPLRRNFRNKVISHFSVDLQFTLNFILLSKTTLEFTPILLHSDSHVDEILTISSSKIIQNPYSNTNK